MVWALERTKQSSATKKKKNVELLQSHLPARVSFLQLSKTPISENGSQLLQLDFPLFSLLH